MPSQLLAAPPSEIEVESVYLYNFTKFVTWPGDAFDSDADPLSLCIYGKPPPTALLASLSSKSTNGRALKIFTVQEHLPQECHLIFFHERAPAFIQRTLGEIGARPILTVGDDPGFAEKYGMIEFMVDADNRVRLAINPKRAQQHRIAISAKLLEIASRVYNDAPAIHNDTP